MVPEPIGLKIGTDEVHGGPDKISKISRAVLLYLRDIVRFDRDRFMIFYEIHEIS